MKVTIKSNEKSVVKVKYNACFYYKLFVKSNFPGQDVERYPSGVRPDNQKVFLCTRSYIQHFFSRSINKTI